LGAADGFPVVVMQPGQAPSNLAGMPLALIGGMVGGMGDEMDLPPHLMEEEPLFLDSSRRQSRHQGGNGKGHSLGAEFRL
jgi:hypothetical protein